MSTMTSAAKMSKDQEMALRFNNLEVGVNFQKNNSRTMVEADKKETMGK